jgi:hypothetical protein
VELCFDNCEPLVRHPEFVLPAPTVFCALDDSPCNALHEFMQHKETRIGDQCADDFSCRDVRM